MKAFIPAMLFALVTSCGSVKKIAYLDDVPDSTLSAPYAITTAAFTNPLIKPNDLLQISILTLDPESNSILTAANSGNFTIQTSSSAAGASPQSVPGFMVDKDGFIELPLAGKIKVAGLTTFAARDSISGRIARLYKDPVVSVRYANFSISILGEVARPANYIVPNEKVSILDAIGMAGDLTIYGKRENVLLMRDSAGQKLFVRFDLSSSALIQSPYFYLQQGDIVYVEPNKAKISSSDAVRTRNITLGASAISLLIVLFSRI
ncbi:MAG: polysaccharide biosynthesis/export family protein [Chitinophagaceae bacterium]